MSERETAEQTATNLVSQQQAPVAPPNLSADPEAANCLNCGAGFTPSPPSYVYAIGKIEPRFPQLSVEKEFAQATGRAESDRLTDRQAAHHVLTRPENRYLARQLCWVMTIEGLETYILIPRDPADLVMLTEALRATPRATDIDVVIGIKGPIASPTFCNGLTVPIVLFDQIYSFDVDTLIGSIPRPEGEDPERFIATAEEVFNRVTQITDNAGNADSHRALNYLAVRYPTVYANAVEQFGRDFSLSEVEVRPSRLSGVRTIVDVIFTYTNRKTGVDEKYFVRVDVTEEFPFLVTKLGPFYER
jgi:hypothetical protein